MKIIKIFLLTSICLLLIIVGGIYLSRDVLLKSLVNKTVEGVLNVPFMIGNLDSQPFLGKLNIINLALGNPEGWSDGNAISFKNFLIDVNTLSVFSDTIIVNEISIDSLNISYDIKLSKLKSNIGVIIDNITTFKDDGNKQKAGANNSSPRAKAFVILKISITNGVISTKLNGIDKYKEIKDIHLENIGNNRRLLINEVIKIILDAILKESKASMSKDGLIKSGQKRSKIILEKLPSPVINKSFDALDKVKGLLKQ